MKMYKCQGTADLCSVSVSTDSSEDAICMAHNNKWIREDRISVHTGLQCMAAQSISPLRYKFCDCHFIRSLDQLKQTFFANEFYANESNTSNFFLPLYYFPLYFRFISSIVLFFISTTEIISLQIISIVSLENIFVGFYNILFVVIWIG